jgi:hypothetical protein
MGAYLIRMTLHRQILFGLALVLARSTGYAQQPAGSGEPLLTADAIMARVATNQDLTEAERGHYVYVQHAHVLSRKGKTVMCEEITDFRVTPSGSGSHEELLKLDGRVLRNHKYVTYTTLESGKNDEDSAVKADHDSLSVEVGDDDRNLVETMRSDLTNDRSRDGIGGRLFPLTSKSQSDYLFHLVGREHVNGRDVYHIDFRPKDKDEFGWKGDAYIDAISDQPVVVRTAMARKIPFGVRTLLGTSLPGLGFTVVYAPQPDGVWFPVSFSTEFKLHVLFFFSREMVIDAQNRDFEKTHVSVKIGEVGEAIQPE